MFGAAGYAVKQMTSDRLRGEVVAAMPEVWDIGRRGQAARSQHRVRDQAPYGLRTYGTRNIGRDRFGGDKFWSKVILPSTSLFGGPKQHSRPAYPTSPLGHAPQTLPLARGEVEWARSRK